jgi:hypothetical protein
LKFLIGILCYAILSRIQSFCVCLALTFTYVQVTSNDSLALSLVDFKYWRWSFVLDSNSSRKTALLAIGCIYCSRERYRQDIEQTSTTSHQHNAHVDTGSLKPMKGTTLVVERGSGTATTHHQTNSADSLIYLALQG